MMNVITLTSELINLHIDDLLAIEQSAHEMSPSIYSVEKWAEAQFTAPLPGKFRHSLAMAVNGRLVAFLISSIRNERSLHIHRIAVHRDFARQGISKRLLSKLMEDFRLNPSLHVMTAIVNVRNTASCCLFEHCGLMPLAGEELKCFMANYQRPGIVLKDDRFIDEHGMEYYLMMRGKERNDDDRDHSSA